jgi:hypothetical protein
MVHAGMAVIWLMRSEVLVVESVSPAVYVPPTRSRNTTYAEPASAQTLAASPPSFDVVPSAPSRSLLASSGADASAVAPESVVAPHLTQRLLAHVSGELHVALP